MYRLVTRTVECPFVAASVLTPTRYRRIPTRLHYIDPDIEIALSLLCMKNTKFLNSAIEFSPHHTRPVTYLGRYSANHLTRETT